MAKLGFHDGRGGILTRNNRKSEKERKDEFQCGRGVTV